ncbi:MAG: agmatine deiminase family protein [Myxococcales bacterium]|nr:agmatine deiminase family protein [Myxococcales bacterium]
MVDGPLPEWHVHAACISAWPFHDYAWGAQLQAAKRQFAAFARAVVAAEGSERLLLLCHGPEAQTEARAAIGIEDGRIDYVSMAYGDIWLRDTAPFFVRRGDGLAALCFDWNGWGDKYLYPHDAELGAALAAHLNLPTERQPAVLEGGAVDFDGEGSCLTTDSCLLNINRNPGWDRARYDGLLSEALGIERVIWLPGGLKNDHTDGHVDNVARFAAPGAVLHMRPSSEDDPNREALLAIEDALTQARDARGRALELLPVPSPGAVLGVDGEIMAASYLNFYLGNRTVVVPAFGRDQDEAARQAIAEAFPGRQAVLCEAASLLEGGGGLHCITHELPALEERTA